MDFYYIIIILNINELKKNFKSVLKVKTEIFKKKCKIYEKLKIGFLSNYVITFAIFRANLYYMNYTLIIITFAKLRNFLILNKNHPVK